MKLRQFIPYILTFTALVFGSLATAVVAEGNAYVGTKKCKMCHMKEWTAWAETKMAKAFEQLKPGESAEAKKSAGLDPARDYTRDVTCLPCHTTGYAQPGGFVDAEKTPELEGVGCEMCHGAGSTYTQAQYMSLQNKEFKTADLAAAGLVGQITEVQCTQCHNRKSPFVGATYVFDFAKRKEQGTHAKFPLKFSH